MSKKRVEKNANKVSDGGKKLEKVKAVFSRKKSFSNTRVPMDSVVKGKKGKDLQSENALI